MREFDSFMLPFLDPVAAMLPSFLRDDIGSVVEAAERQAAAEIEEKRRQLVTWDFSLTRAVLMREEGVSESVAKERQAEYLMWMENILMGRKNPPITKSCDSFWHTHIICTQDYAKFCKQVVGHFVHHIPNVGDTKDKCGPCAQCKDGICDSGEVEAVRSVRCDVVWTTCSGR